MVRRTYSAFPVYYCKSYRLVSGLLAFLVRNLVLPFVSPLVIIFYLCDRQAMIHAGMVPANEILEIKKWNSKKYS